MIGLIILGFVLIVEVFFAVVSLETEATAIKNILNNIYLAVSRTNGLNYSISLPDKPTDEQLKMMAQLHNSMQSLNDKPVFVADHGVGQYVDVTHFESGGNKYQWFNKNYEPIETTRL